ncbi:DNA helicase HerA-like ATPase [Stackebrandtia endophytica]|uniref:DNA helicase HerA-like ATPase n=1 Tax=Stackebrandtia endophytica TaxID=1496996 RepID=A0A543AWX4_9ACTN|nr:ATP-binding protein [Stackebrandtia endophytica]TQL77050.1 DNA helicase HerA-like ATPase [Stackebrandtia endophytica]
MTSSPPPPTGPSADTDSTTRPLAVFKAPKSSEPDPTTALADVLFGERASRTMDPSGERASRGASETTARPQESAEDEDPAADTGGSDADESGRPVGRVTDDGTTPAVDTASIFGEWGRPLADDASAEDAPTEPESPRPGVSVESSAPSDVGSTDSPESVETSNTSASSASDESRHAISPADNPRSPQEYPQGYPQADRAPERDFPQGNPQKGPGYPQDETGYPQAKASYPQVAGTVDAPSASGYPQDVVEPSSAPPSDGAQPDSTAPPLGPGPSGSPAATTSQEQFGQQEQRVLERIQARQRAQQLAAQREAASHGTVPGDDTRTGAAPSAPAQPDAAQTDTAQAGTPRSDTARPDTARRSAAQSAASPEEPVRQPAAGSVQPDPATSRLRPRQPEQPPPSRTRNPFAEAEVTARAQDEARRTAAGQTSGPAAEPSTGSRPATGNRGRPPQSVVNEMTQVRSGPIRFTAPPPPTTPVGHPTAPPPAAPVGHPTAPQSPAAEPIRSPSGQFPVVPHPTVDPLPPPPAIDPRLSSRPTPVPGNNQLVPYTPPTPPVNDGPVRVPKTPRQRDRTPAQELAITEIAGHATFTPTSVTAWYRLPEVRWAFRPDAEREALISAISEQYAGMAGYRLHLRRTTRPFPADEWARTVDMNTPAPLPAVLGANNWGDHLVAAQRHLHGVQHSEGQVYLGISFARRNLFDTMSEKWGRLFSKGTRDSERSRVDRLTEQFDEVLGAFGVRARRATSHELEWLIFRSVALGMEPPELLSAVRDGNWEPGDVLALTEQIERYRTPYGSTVKLVNRLTGEERHVAVLTVGRMEDLEIPERHEPWLHFHERAPWPMELSSRIDVLGPGEAFRNLEHRLRMIRSQQHDYDEHSMDAPPELERLAQRALVVGDEMTTGMATDAARVHGWHRIAVAADSREECLERARKLIQMYNRELRISLQHPKNQDWLAREFIPGEPVANTGYLRRMPVRLFAASLPQAASNVGDRRGDLIGRTAGTCRRPVFLDLHFPTEVRERSGLAVFVAEPGGGKSTLMGALGYLAARRGVQVTLLDPSGPLARLCEMPELKPYSKVLNLTGSESGTLAPYALIPTPKREHWGPGAEADREFHIAVSNARAERRMLVQDICSMLVPPQVAREASTARLLRHAARQVPAEETSTLEDIVDCLQEQGEEGSELAALLLDTAEMPLAMLFFGSPPSDMLTDDAMLTVITMAGLRLPDLKIEREYWSAEEALALPMLHTAHRLAVRRSYGGDINRRKLVGLDEAHFMEGWRSGRSFLVRMARDSRKWNLAALVASQNPKDILGLDVQNLVSTVFVGRIAEDAEIAAEALRMLRVPRDVGYEQTLASLSEPDAGDDTRLPYREFIMRDVDGRVQRVRADISYVPGLLDHLDTTPGSPDQAGRPNARPTSDPADPGARTAQSTSNQEQLAPESQMG